MRHRTLLLARALLAVGPVALAFASGGFFDEARLVAVVVAAAALALAALSAPVVLPQGPAARTAALALAALAGWTAASSDWAPLADPAGDDAERLGLYVLAFLAGLAAWRGRAAGRALEPLVLAGALIVVGFGLAGRLLPSLVELTATAGANGRLEQPLTYWNAMGALAAVGFVLAARLAGERERPAAHRALAAATAVPLLTGVALSFSRGAIAALAGGLIVLLVLAPTWSQLRAVAITLETGLLAVAASLALPAVRRLGDGDADLQGAVVLVVLLGAMALAAVLTRWAARTEATERVRLGRLPLPPWAGVAATVAVLALVVVPVVASGEDRARNPRADASATRLVAVDSNRYAYWRVALEAWSDEPLRGVGASGFQTTWTRERPFVEAVRDAHSLPLETLAELGLVGLLLLLTAAGAVARCARRVQATDPALAAGPAAALTAWALHACLDWDWELPALTLPALGLAAMLVARADATPAPPR